MAIADPIDPVTEEDDRPSVKALIDEHRKMIDKVKAEVQQEDLYDPTKHDDLWFLRFCMSHKKSKPAIKAAKHTLKFREEHNLDLKDIRDRKPQDVKEGILHDFWRKKMVTDEALVLTLPDKRRSVVVFLKFADIEQHESVKTV